MGLMINKMKFGGGLIDSRKIEGMAYKGNIIFKNKKIKIYGIKRSLTSTSTKWDRTDDSINLVAKAIRSQSDLTNNIKNDFDELYPWSEIKTVNVDANGNINAYIGDSNFSWYSLYVMTIIPEFWYKRWQDENYEYIQIAESEVKGFTKSERFMVSRYDASGSTSAIRSRSSDEPLVSTTLYNFQESAKKIGTGWHIMDWKYFILQLLYLVEYADYNSQDILGYGAVLPSIVNNGGCDSLKMKSGSLANDKKTPIIYRGVENIFGNVAVRLDGIIIKDKVPCICYNPANYSDLNKYTSLNYTLTTQSGYIKKVGCDSNHSLVQMAIEVGGSSTTYIPDIFNANTGGVYHPVVGGSWASDEGGGIFWCQVNRNDGNADGGVGTRLIKEM